MASNSALFERLSALLSALRDQPLRRPELIERLRDHYPPGDSARRSLDRDIEHLGALGIVVARDSSTRPPRYTLSGGTPVFDAAELRTLALIRDSFGDRHPQTEQIRALLGRLTRDLTAVEQRVYRRRQALRAPIQPAIDYTPYETLIARLDEAIGQRRKVAFHYRPGGQSQATPHHQVEPYEIEFYERHLYLVAYTHNSGQVLDFRIDRIDGATLRLLPDTWPGPRRPLIAFRYRLAAVVARGEVSQRFEEQQVVERLPNGDVVVAAKGRSDFFIVRTLLRYAGNAELLDPPWLREQMARELERAAALYRAGGEGNPS